MSDTIRPQYPDRAPTAASTSPLQKAAEDGRAAVADISSQANATTSQVRDVARDAVSDIKAEGADVAEAAKDRALGFAEKQKRVGADQAEGLARAVHGAADNLQDTSPQIAQYVHDAAAAMDGFARTLRNNSPGQLMGYAEDLARNRPVAFFGTAVLAGFALARFAKSSAAEAQRSGSRLGSQASGQSASGGSQATPHATTTDAPGWVPASSGCLNDDAVQPPRPATMAAASLGGAAARPAASASSRDPLGEAG
jgi:hypothetical protein